MTYLGGASSLTLHSPPRQRQNAHGRLGACEIVMTGPFCVEMCGRRSPEILAHNRRATMGSHLCKNFICQFDTLSEIAIYL